MPMIKAFVFDVYGTLFDVHSVKEKCDTYFPSKGEAISNTWRQKQIEYSFLRQLMNTYDTFFHVTRNSLNYAVKEQGEQLSTQQEQDLLNSYLHLSLYPEVVDVINQLSHQKLAVFSNGSHDMLDPLIENSKLTGVFNHIISVDEVKQYKPTPASYQHCIDSIGVKPEEVLFMSTNGWDISGAKNFGFNTAWINRKNLPVEELALTPDDIYKDLTGILEWKS